MQNSNVEEDFSFVTGDTTLRKLHQLSRILFDSGKGPGVILYGHLASGKTQLLRCIAKLHTKKPVKTITIYPQALGHDGIFGCFDGFGK